MLLVNIRYKRFDWFHDRTAWVMAALLADGLEKHLA